MSSSGSSPKQPKPNPAAQVDLKQANSPVPDENQKIAKQKLKQEKEAKRQAVEAELWKVEDLKVHVEKINEALARNNINLLVNHLCEFGTYLKVLDEEYQRRMEEEPRQERFDRFVEIFAAASKKLTLTQLGNIYYSEEMTKSFPHQLLMDNVYDELPIALVDAYLLSPIFLMSSALSAYLNLTFPQGKLDKVFSHIVKERFKSEYRRDVDPEKMSKDEGIKWDNYVKQKQMLILHEIKKIASQMRLAQIARVSGQPKMDPAKLTSYFDKLGTRNEDVLEDLLKPYNYYLSLDAKTIGNLDDELKKHVPPVVKTAAQFLKQNQVPDTLFDIELIKSRLSEFDLAVVRASLNKFDLPLSLADVADQKNYQHTPFTSTLMSMLVNYRIYQLENGYVVSQKQFTRICDLATHVASIRVRYDEALKGTKNVRVDKQLIFKDIEKELILQLQTVPPLSLSEIFNAMNYRIFYSLSSLLNENAKGRLITIMDKVVSYLAHAMGVPELDDKFKGALREYLKNNPTLSEIQFAKTYDLITVVLAIVKARADSHLPPMLGVQEKLLEFLHKKSPNDARNNIDTIMKQCNLIILSRPKQEKESQSLRELIHSKLKRLSDSPIAEVRDAKRNVNDLKYKFESPLYVITDELLSICSSTNEQMMMTKLLKDLPDTMQAYKLIYDKLETYITTLPLGSKLRASVNELMDIYHDLSVGSPLSPSSPLTPNPAGLQQLSFLTAAGGGAAAAAPAPESEARDVKIGASVKKSSSG